MKVTKIKRFENDTTCDCNIERFLNDNKKAYLILYSDTDTVCCNYVTVYNRIYVGANNKVEAIRQFRNNRDKRYNNLIILAITELSRIEFDELIK